MTFNEVIDLDTERKVARQVRVPAPILLLLFGFLIMTAAVLGYVLEERRAWIGACVLFVLLSLYVSIIADLNRPASGSIQESQEPMLMLRQSLKAQPPQVFDRFHGERTAMTGRRLRLDRRCLLPRPCSAAASMGPDYVKPEVEVPPAYRFGELTAETVQQPAWWNAYADPHLDGLVREALANNRDLQDRNARGSTNSRPSSPARGRRRLPQVGYGLSGNRSRASEQNIPDFVDPLSTTFSSLLVGQLGNRPLGPHPPRDRSRARQPAGDRGSAPRRHPDPDFVGDHDLRHSARLRRAIAGHAGDRRRPQEIGRAVRDEAGGGLDLRIRNVAGARRI